MSCSWLIDINLTYRVLIFCIILIIITILGVFFRIAREKWTYMYYFIHALLRWWIRPKKEYCSFVNIYRLHFWGFRKINFYPPPFAKFSDIYIHVYTHKHTHTHWINNNYWGWKFCVIYTMWFIQVIICSLIFAHKCLFVRKCLFLAHISRRLKWAFLIWICLLLLLS